MKHVLLLFFIVPILNFSQINYETQIQPIFNANCIECHQGSASYYGGLSLISYDELIEGGYTDGGVISTGLLEEYITTGYMPDYGSGNQLTNEEINLIVQWISEGALEEGLTPCQQEIANSTGLLGEFIPDCEEDGSYTPMQCNASTGYCWCVDENGVEIPGTAIQSWVGTPDCSSETGCIDDDYTMQIGLNNTWTSGINDCTDGVAFLVGAGYGCGTSLYTLNNPFWGSNPNEFISDICGCTCDNYGCTDPNACNYNSDSTNDDGSCEYPDFGYDCDGNCLEDLDNDGICDTCEEWIYGVADCECEFFDPNTYTVFFTTVDEENCEIWDDCYCECYNDTDGDGICDENEIIFGCTDSLACNVFWSATEDDGSCEYPGEECLLPGSIGPDFEYGLWNENCECIANLSIDEYNNHKALIKVVDVLGREIDKENKDALLLYIYDDGSVEKKYKP